MKTFSVLIKAPDERALMLSFDKSMFIKPLRVDIDAWCKHRNIWVDDGKEVFVPHKQVTDLMLMVYNIGGKQASEAADSALKLLREFRLGERGFCSSFLTVHGG